MQLSEALNKQLRIKIQVNNFKWHFDDSFIAIWLSEFENDERVIKMSLENILTNFYS